METYPLKSKIVIHPSITLKRYDAYVDELELNTEDMSKINVDYIVNWMVDEVLTLKYFAILDNPKKAAKFNFNDGFN